jgi:WD40 repeat protein
MTSVSPVTISASFVGIDQRWDFHDINSVLANISITVQNKKASCLRVLDLRPLCERNCQVCGLKWSHDDRELASGGNDNQLLVWNQRSQQPVLRLTEHTAAVKAIAWSPHQQGLLASGGGTADRCIRFWNTANGNVLNSIDTGSQASSSSDHYWSLCCVVLLSSSFAFCCRFATLRGVKMWMSLWAHMGIPKIKSWCGNIHPCQRWAYMLWILST